MEPEVERAHDELIQRHAPGLLATARRFLHSEKDARDAVQEVLLRALDDIPGLKQPKEKLDAWLHGDVVDVCLRKLRDEPGAPEPEIEHLLPRFDEKGGRIEPTPKAVPAPAQRPEPSQLVRASIAQLPEIYRIVLLLRDVEGLSTDETAEALGLDANAVKIRLHRARQAMLTLMRPHLAEAAS